MIISRLSTHSHAIEKYMSATKNHCCEPMQSAVTHQCDKHPSVFDCPDALIYYSSPFDKYGLIVHDGGSSYITISYCPWCGASLTSDGTIVHNDSIYKNFLLDFGLLLKEEARDAKHNYDQYKDSDNEGAAYNYHSGYVMALHHIISLLQHQSDLFEISRRDLQLDDIDPDKELI
jgi:hypothetical protein